MTRARRIRAEHDPHYGKSGYARIPNEAYFTRDERCAPPLLRFLPELRERRVWECAAGGYDLAEDLRTGGVRRIVCSDILRYRPAPKGLRPSRLVDFLSVRRAPAGVTAIVTNPPNLLSRAFVEHALRLMRAVNGLVAVLVPMAWGATPGRLHLLDGFPPFRLQIVFTFRPWWFEPRAGDNQPRNPWQWLVWDWSNRQPAQARYA